MDWFPTVLELCDVPKPKVKLDGRSLLSIIESPDSQSEHAGVYFQWINSWAVREGEWKLIRKKGRGENSNESFSLHNLADEKPEVQNYFRDKPDIVMRLKELYAIWARDVFDGQATGQ